MTRSKAIEKARAIKTQRVKDKIQSAINVLNLYGDVKITVRAIAEESGVSKTTVQKYISAQKEAKNTSKEVNFEVDTSLKVPYSEKEEVKKLGAIWNVDKKAWIAPAGTPREPFAKWIL